MRAGQTSGVTPTLFSWSLWPGCRPHLSTHRPPPSFAEKNCSYFRHFNPGETSEIFQVTTQKGEPLVESREGRGERPLSQAAVPENHLARTTPLLVLEGSSSWS